MSGTPGPEAVSTNRKRHAIRARHCRRARTESSAHHTRIVFVRKVFQRTLEDAEYTALPARQVATPKAEAWKTWRAGGPAFEHRLPQRAVAMVLETIDQQACIMCLDGFRLGHSTHPAMQLLRRRPKRRKRHGRCWPEAGRKRGVLDVAGQRRVIVRREAVAARAVVRSAILGAMTHVAKHAIGHGDDLRSTATLESEASRLESSRTPHGRSRRLGESGLERRGARPSLPSEAVASALVEARREAGLHYVYEGNVPGEGGEDTFCHQCQALLIQRYGFTLLANRVVGGRCPDCGAALPGLWQASP